MVAHGTAARSAASNPVAKPLRKVRVQRTLFLALVLLMLSASLGKAQKRASDPAGQREINEIQRYAMQLEVLTKDKRNSPRIFADVSSARQDGPSKWTEFKTEMEKETASTGENLNEQADVWTKNGNVVCVQMLMTSPSGDWAHFISYYFREDGSLAKIDAQLNTFYGDITVKRSRFYSASGKQLRSSTRYFDLQTQKPKQNPGEYFNHSIPVFTRVNRLPFFELL